MASVDLRFLFPELNSQKKKKMLVADLILVYVLILSLWVFLLLVCRPARKPLATVPVQLSPVPVPPPPPPLPVPVPPPPPPPLPEKEEAPTQKKVPTSKNITKRQRKLAKQEAARLRLEKAKEQASKTVIGTVQKTLQAVPAYVLDWSHSSTDAIKQFSRKATARVLGTHKIAAADLHDLLAEMEHRLIAKNVRMDVARRLTDIVRTELIGKTLGTFERLATVVKSALRKELSVIAQSQTRDLVQEALDEIRKKKPFVFLISGPNGVGKTSTIAKLCVWLQSHGLQCSLAACDTFRTGAVEQLRTHAYALQVRLCESGYQSDSAKVATHAIREAQAAADDVLLIDSAGRMHGNKRLMNELGNLVQKSNPDLVLFVGEALTGNDGYEQLKQFNSTVADFRPNHHGVDRLVLTKFDTVDDKIGAVINLMVDTHIPILFVGIGQTYRDLRSLSVDTILHLLLL